MKEDPIIVCEHVNFAYRDSLVLCDASLQVNRGEFLGIIGPNGGGKTTLLKLLMGFLEPLSGFISILGKPPKEARSEIAYVPQGLRFDRQFPISVTELVLAGRLSRLPWYGIYGTEDLEAANKALNTVGLYDIRHQAFGTLSGGQAQRVLIARALVSDPKILLLDEPTASVDAQAEGVIYDILKELRGKMTILMVTHDLNVAVNLVDKVICVQRGISALLPQQVCEHFAIGLYHTPLLPGNPKGGNNA
jgi:zinc transport system ATP-binding protein